MVRIQSLTAAHVASRAGVSTNEPPNGVIVPPMTRSPAARDRSAISFRPAIRSGAVASNPMSLTPSMTITARTPDWENTSRSSRSSAGTP